MQDLRKDLHASGRCPELAGLLSGVQGEAPAGGYSDQKVPEMREDFHFLIQYPPLAEILPGMPGKADSLKYEHEVHVQLWISAEWTIWGLTVY